MSKKNLRLGLVWIILIILAYLYQGPAQNWQKAKQKKNIFMSNVKLEEISKIEVKSEEASTVLERENDNWKVANTKDFYVSSTTKMDLEDGLEEFIKSKLDLISENKDKKAEFATDENGILITLYKGDDKKAEFVVGKMGSDYQSTYISQNDNDSTYLAPLNLYNIFSRREWRDKMIFSFTKEDVNKIRFQYPDRSFIVEKVMQDDQEKWVGIGPGQFDISSEAKINQALDALSNLTATQIPDQTFAGTGLEKHSIIIQVTGKDIDNTIMVGDANESGDYYAKKAESDNIYLISQGQRDNLDLKLEDLK